MGARDLREWLGEIAHDVWSGVFELTANAATRLELRMRGPERISDLQSAHLRLWNRINLLEERVTPLEDQANIELGDIIGTVLAEVASLAASDALKTQALVNAGATIDALRTQLSGAEADKAAAVSQAVQDALAADSATDTARVQAYIEQLKAALPAGTPVPDVPVPDAGQPAEPPADSAVDVPVIDPVPLPDPSADIPVLEPSTGENPAVVEDDTAV